MASGFMELMRDSGITGTHLMVWTGMFALGLLIGKIVR
jgi:hypothetical protein